MTTYRPRKIGFKNIALAFIPLLVIIGVSFAFKASNPLSFLEGFFLFILFLGIFIFLGFNSTYIEVETNKIKIVKFLIFRNSISISNIESLKYRSLGNRSLDGITIHYKTKHGLSMSAVFGSIGAYGEKQISSIVDQISKLNPSIEVEEKLRSLTKD
jgi:hypothetical protein